MQLSSRDPSLPEYRHILFNQWVAAIGSGCDPLTEMENQLAPENRWLARWSVTLVAATHDPPPLFAPRSPATATPSLGNGERRCDGRPCVATSVSIRRANATSGLVPVER